MQIKQETKIKITMTQEERQALKKAVDILTELELEEDTDNIDLLEEIFEKDDNIFKTNLAKSIDYIGMLLKNCEEEQGGNN
jgi:5'-deoxynucleotidase YfbR-like HD superfamily hydrolase